ncbi:MAG: hypothetical protein B7X56_05405 [Burkholderiales bacterium 34-67-9]|nr:MAG: hypothetical protein B7X56_05405 [Burkholderiales bacterium 34-67-9]
MEAQIHGVIQPMSASDRDELAKAQARADSLARMLGDEVTAALGGEKPIAYRKRLAARFQKHSPSVKTVKLDSLDAESFAVIEERIYADAMQAALNPNDGTAGRLIPQVYRDSSGREITKFHGDIGAWMAPFMSPGLSAVINRRKEAA